MPTFPALRKAGFVLRSPVELLQDNYKFGGIDSGKWNIWGTLNVVATTNLDLEITSANGYTDYGGTTSKRAFDLTSSYAMQQLLDAGSQLSGLEVYPVELTVGNNALSVMIAGNTVYARQKINGSYGTVGSTVAYNSTTMKWFRVREADGTIYWEYAQDPTSTWTIIATQATNACPFSIKALIGGSTLGTWTTIAQTTAKFANFNVIPGQYQFPWQGYTWNKRIHIGDPTSNTPMSTENVSLPDQNNYLTFTLDNPSGNEPVGAEIFSEKRGFGYGTYLVVVRTELDTMDHRVGWGGMFTFDFTAYPDYKEVDVDETRDYNGNTAVQLLHTLVWNNGGVRNFNVQNQNMPANTPQTHRMIWSPGKIQIDTFAGVGVLGTNLFSTTFTSNVPTPGLERVHFNIWNNTGVANYLQAPKTQVVISDFSWTPLLITKSLQYCVKTTVVPGATQHTSPNLPTTSIDDSGGNFNYFNINNINAIDGQVASVATNSSIFEVVADVTSKGFGFNIPSTAVITGIQVTINRSASMNMTSPNNRYITDNQLQLTKDGTTLVGSNKADTNTHWPTTLTSAVYGSSSDLWGTTWTPADLNSANFGVYLMNQGIDDSGGTTSANIDYISVEVFYTLPGIQRTLKYCVKTTPSALTKSLKYTIKTTPSAMTKSLRYCIDKAYPITKSLKYCIKRTPSALTKSLKYCVKTIPSALTKSLKYCIDKPIAITKSLKYCVKTTPSALTKSLKYCIKTTPSAITKSLKYCVKTTPSAITKSLQYIVNASSIDITKSLKYCIKRTPSALTKSLKYCVKTTPSALTKSVKYCIKTSVSLTKSLKYCVKTTPSALTKSLKYTIKTTPVAITKSLRYTIKVVSPITKSLKYCVKTTPSALTKSLKYCIKTTPSALTKSLRYCVKTTPAALTKSLKYCIKASVSITKSLKYTVKTTPAALTKSLKYTIKTAPTAMTKSLRYCIKSNPAITKSLKYTVKKTGIGITKSLQYVVKIGAPGGGFGALYFGETYFGNFNLFLVSTLSITKSLSYTIKKQTSITKSLQYAVLRNTTNIKKTLKYTIRLAQIRKSLRYDIVIANYVDLYDIQNTVYSEYYGANNTQYNDLYKVQGTQYTDEYKP